MSVFGGDSWGREAQYRKRRVDDLLLDAADHSSHRKLPTGKYVCLVCPHSPVLDTPLMLSCIDVGPAGRRLTERARKLELERMHMKASRHCAAERKLKQREEERQNEMNKRIALSLDSTSMSKTGNTPIKQTNFAGKPLIEKTRKATLEVLDGYPEKSAASNSQSRWQISERACDLTNSTSVQMEGSGKDVVQLPLDYRERRERELRFTAAGWKRDCHGGWFRDENVEFDSDEEDPNVSLAIRGE